MPIFSLQDKRYAGEPEFPPLPLLSYSYPDNFIQICPQHMQLSRLPI